MRRMRRPSPLPTWFHPSLEWLRLRLSRPEALVWHAAIGLLTGLLAGAVIVGFRLAVEGAQAAWLPEHGENYEALAIWVRLLLPLAGALVIGVIFLRFAQGIQVLGVARVMERMEYHQGYLTLRGFVLQFVGAAIAIVSGHSVGREGPHVHLGAASGSLLGQLFSLPNNSIRTMAACGTAAGIAASFNTPLAGVIFALEVLALPYSIGGFIPVTLAAVSANAVAVAVFGSAPVLLLPPFVLGSLADLLPVLLLGVLAGAVAAAYIQSLQGAARLAGRLGGLRRYLVAGLAAGLIGVLVPEVMGLGYDTQQTLLTGQAAWGFLVVLLVAKLAATALSVGLGIPGGNIGPALFMGAIVGNLTAVISGFFVPLDPAHVTFYTLLGMGAMMGASLQAPLAALTAIVELSHNPGVMMPGMLAIVIAALTCRQLFGKDSMFLTLLRAKGLDYRANPVIAILRRSGVASVMNTGFVRQQRLLDRAKAERLVADAPDWIIVDQDGAPSVLMPGLAVASELARTPETVEIDLLEIPAERFELAPIHLQATLQEAIEQLNARGVEALYVQRPLAPGIDHVYGVLTRGRIESAYRY
ncbi:H+/Cl- antiporter ClcA [Marichromatium gracile]|uniref:H+/Cl-antiporter ClcA n=2 Tax=Marichromatium gracile TaxID=1048 RepID=A0A4R4AKB5_MARGR|nr:chloride channel protein [Marichromatium gracile]TCW39857.1 H+/Cl- antiporter ClcA [Marichromatium gracile]